MKVATRTHDASFLNNTNRTAVLVMYPKGDVSACGSQQRVVSKASFSRLVHDPITTHQSSTVMANGPDGRLVSSPLATLRETICATGRHYPAP